MTVDVSELMRRVAEKERENASAVEMSIQRLRTIRPKTARQKRRHRTVDTCFYCGVSVRRGSLVCAACEDLPSLESEGLL